MRRLVVVMATVVVVAGGATLIRATPSEPTGQALLSQLKRYGDLAAARPEESRWTSLTPAQAEVVAGAAGFYALLSAVGRNGIGQTRSFFALFEQDETTGEWRPLYAIDGPVDALNSFDSEVLSLPDGDTSYVGFLGAPPGAEIDYLTTDGGYRTLGAVGPAGFALTPPDAAQPIQIVVSESGSRGQ